MTGSFGGTRPAGALASGASRPLAREPYISDYQNIKIGKSTGVYKDKGDHIEISSIRTPQKYRGQGQAGKIIEHINNIADESKKPVKLLASPLDKKTTTSKLVNLYKKYGYKLTGEKGNIVGDPWMERPAKIMLKDSD
jgi:predicted GNAT family acetyltransferase